MRKVALSLMAVLFLTGCITPRIDWSSRVGTYTYDQAVMDFGPPDKSAKLADGATVAEWVTQHAHTIIAPEPYFLQPGCYYGPFTPSYSESYVPDYFLRLDFDPTGKLRSWKKFAR